ncbi:MAG: metalloregulator ArsR/SmtB family transcription factor [Acidobacteriota bacterium]|jgi:ArsR family transcriptional regulator
MAKYRLQDFMDVTRALADESRIRTLLALEQGELCVCQITEILDLAPSTVSKHMALLRQARLVDSRKEGRWIYYRLPDDPSPAVRQALDWVCRSLKEAPEIAGDRQHLQKVICLEPEALCEIQRARV